MKKEAAQQLIAEHPYKVQVALKHERFVFITDDAEAANAGAIPIVRAWPNSGPKAKPNTVWAATMAYGVEPTRQELQILREYNVIVIGETAHASMEGIISFLHEKDYPGLIVSVKKDGKPNHPDWHLPNFPNFGDIGQVASATCAFIKYVDEMIQFSGPKTLT